MSFQHAIQRVMSGEARGPLPALGRLALATLEPFYRAAVTYRNRRFDRRPDRIRRLSKPVVSIGNLTTGGTGKTPVVRYLAERLRDRGIGVAILSRGYKSAPGTLGDEQRMLLSLLNEPDPSVHAAPLVIEADPDRYQAGVRALEREPRIDLFLLDDGFQHRKLHRDLDVVLLHADEPFGFGRVLPRGLLREPVSGLARAGAVVFTNATSQNSGRRAEATALLPLRASKVGGTGRATPQPEAVPVYSERHEPTGFRSADATLHPADALKNKQVLAFSGLAMPGGFERQVAALSAGVVRAVRFPDHHDYTAADVDRLRQQATASGAEVLITTEKDWVKLSALPGASDGSPPIWRLDIEARFSGDDGDRLVNQIAALLQSGPDGAALKEPRTQYSV